MNKDTWVLLTLPALLVVACSNGDPTRTPDASTSADAATRADAGDASTETDAGAPADADAQPEAVYVTMRDGTDLAVDVWRAADTPQPVVLRLTRYWRGTEYLDPRAREADREEGLDRAMMMAGFVVVAVDARGTGASFGTSRAPWAPEEIADYGEIADWIVTQPWSNGQIAVFGISYDANAAMMLAALGHPAVKVIAPLFPDFDPFLSVAAPGGITNVGFVRAWDAMNHALDTNDACTLALFTGQSCEERRAMISGPRPVDPARLPAAIAAHANNLDLTSALLGASCRDDVLGASGLTFDAISPYAVTDGLGRARVPTLMRVGWHDANTVAGALAWFATMSGPEVLIIGATNHAGLLLADPFGDPTSEPSPSFPEQLVETFTFFGQVLGGAPVTRVLRYQTMGSGAWHETTTWPPAGTSTTALYLAEGHALTARAPTERDASDSVQVDDDASTGLHNRWLTPLDASPIIYGDRRVQDASLLVYDGAPLEADLEITGDPRAVLWIAESAESPVFVYLEAVAPDGAVRYLTEGLLAPMHRAVPASPPGAAIERSFRRAELSPFVANEMMRLELPLAPISVVVPAGHHLRVAISGADADTFGPPAHADTVLTVARDAARPSHVVIPSPSR